MSENNIKKDTSLEICRIAIVFPVSSDEHALECKNKIADILKDIANVRFDFNLTMTPRPLQSNGTSIL